MSTNTLNIMNDDFMTTCLSLLENGFISSYITLFAYKDTPASSLASLTALLTDLETALHKGSKHNIYNAYKALAFLFLSEVGMLHRAIHYFEQGIKNTISSYI